jgi:serine/threonine protein phosphatase PrpC
VAGAATYSPPAPAPPPSTIVSALHGDSRKGYAPYNQKKENQDSMIMHEDQRSQSLLLAVFDGHGEQGHVVSRFLRERITAECSRHPRFGADPGAVFREAIATAEAALIADRRVDTQLSGSTAVLATIRGDLLTVGNVGDSRCIVGTEAGGRVVGVEISHDHKPDTPAEKARIERTGGRVFAMTYDDGEDGPARVWLADKQIPGLAMSRSVCDEVAKIAGVISTAEIFTHRLSPADHFVCLASDGLWEFMSNQEVTDIIVAAREPVTAVARLMEESKRRWQAHEPVVDDTTIIVAFVNGRGR